MKHSKIARVLIILLAFMFITGTAHAEIEYDVNIRPKELYIIVSDSGNGTLLTGMAGDMPMRTAYELTVMDVIAGLIDARSFSGVTICALQDFDGREHYGRDSLAALNVYSFIERMTPAGDALSLSTARDIIDLFKERGESDVQPVFMLLYGSDLKRFTDEVNSLGSIAEVASAHSSRLIYLMGDSEMDLSALEQFWSSEPYFNNIEVYTPGSTAESANECADAILSSLLTNIDYTYEPFNYVADADALPVYTNYVLTLDAPEGRSLDVALMELITELDPQYVANQLSDTAGVAAEITASERLRVIMDSDALNDEGGFELNIAGELGADVEPTLAIYRIEPEPTALELLDAALTDALDGAELIYYEDGLALRLAKPITGLDENYYYELCIWRDWAEDKYMAFPTDTALIPLKPWGSGYYDVEVATLSDGKRLAYVSIPDRLEFINTAPTLSGDSAVFVGEYIRIPRDINTYTIDLSAYFDDAESDALSYYMRRQDDAEDSHGAALEGSALTIDMMSTGVHSVQVYAYDGENYSDALTISYDVTDANTLLSAITPTVNPEVIYKGDAFTVDASLSNDTWGGAANAAEFRECYKALPLTAQLTDSDGTLIESTDAQPIVSDEAAALSWQAALTAPMDMARDYRLQLYDGDTLLTSLPISVTNHELKLVDGAKTDILAEAEGFGENAEFTFDLAEYIQTETYDRLNIVPAEGGLPFYVADGELIQGPHDGGTGQLSWNTAESSAMPIHAQLNTFSAPLGLDGELPLTITDQEGSSVTLRLSIIVKSPMRLYLLIGIALLVVCALVIALLTLKRRRQLNARRGLIYNITITTADCAVDSGSADMRMLHGNSTDLYALLLMAGMPPQRIISVADAGAIKLNPDNSEGRFMISVSSALNTDAPGAVRKGMWLKGCESVTLSNSNGSIVISAALTHSEG